VIGFEQFNHASATDVGVKRAHNQDDHAVLLAGDAERWREQGHIFLVADGMGGHAVGELASKLAADIIPHTYHKHAADGPEAALRKAFIEANASINARGQQNRDFHRMGTTSTALLFRPEGAWIGHVGDSRAYRIRDGQIEQLTFDHSLVWEMARRHKVDPDGLHGVATNVIVRSLGPEPLVEVDVEGPHPLRAGDVFLLCSDGLSGQLTDTEIGAVASVLPPAEACRCLVNLANLRGGPDNITVMMVQVRGTPSPDEPAPEPDKPRRSRRWSYWPLAALGLGVIFAGGAIWEIREKQLDLSIYASVLAVLSILAGLTGLTVNHILERRRPPEGPRRRKPKAYRQTTCAIERPLVDRIARAVATSRSAIPTGTPIGPPTTSTVTARRNSLGRATCRPPFASIAAPFDPWQRPCNSNARVRKTGNRSGRDRRPCHDLIPAGLVIGDRLGSRNQAPAGRRSRPLFCFPSPSARVRRGDPPKTTPLWRAAV
jgi:protein phosphatase